MEQLENGFRFVSSTRQMITDRGVLAVVSLLSYLSVSVEELNLYLAAIVKIGTIITTISYLLLNRRRICIAILSLFKKKKKRKK